MKIVITYGGNITVFNDVYAVIDDHDKLTLDFWKHNHVSIQKSKIEEMEILPHGKGTVF